MSANPLQQVPVRRPRVLRDYTIPEARRKDDPGLPKKITIAPLSVDQELLASKLGGFNGLKIRYEAAKMAIAEIDGKPIHNGEGALDELWERLGPVLRSLLLQAYEKLSAPEDSEEKGFFESETVRVV